MNKEQLLDKMYQYYSEGINKIDSLIDLIKEIRNNLETLEGVEEELDSCRIEFGIVSKHDIKYKELNDIWEELNKLKTEYERKGV